MDIRQELQAYEVEYHVLSEEMAFSPVQPLKSNISQQQLSTSSSSAEEKPAPWNRVLERRRSSVDLELMYRLEHQNRCLKHQNIELLEKLQVLTKGLKP